jgi:uncharacterized protein (DUF302 family)
MSTFEYTVATEKPFEETVVAIEKRVGEKGFRVLHTHDVAATLAEKGYPREPLKLIEICNARYASQVGRNHAPVKSIISSPTTPHWHAK